MACGALVIGSDTAPVREVIRDGENGLLTDFFDVEALASKVGNVLKRPEDYSQIRLAARQTITEEYALDRCLPMQLNLVNALTGG